MAALRKFLFETTFDGIPEPELQPAESADPSAADVDDEAEDEAPPVPTFSEAEMESARAEAFAAGRDDGVREAAEAVERQAAEAFDGLVAQLPELFAAQKSAAAEAARDATLVAVTIVRKMLPDLAARNALEEVARVVDEAMARIREEPRVQLRVAPDVRDKVAERLAPRLSDMGVSERVVVIGDQTLSGADCALQWADGGLERDTAALWREIDAIIERNIVPGEGTSEVTIGVGSPANGDPDAGESADDADESADDTIGTDEDAEPGREPAEGG